VLDPDLGNLGQGTLVALVLGLLAAQFFDGLLALLDYPWLTPELDSA
jgi:hypothetical protein